MTWLEGFEPILVARKGSPYRLTNVPWRFVGHTTETRHGTARAVSKAYPFPPHCTVDPKTKERYQHVPLSLAAYALKRLPGAVETNHARAIQVEVVGYAAETHTWPGEWWDWLGEMVLAPIARAVPINLTKVPTTHGTGEGMVLATARSPIRMSPADWLAFDGVTSHQRVPGNDHWDMGRADLRRAANAARRATKVVSASTEPDRLTDLGDDMQRRLVTIPITDDQGNGWVEIDVPFEKVASVFARTGHPLYFNRYLTPQASACEAPDGRTMVQLTGWEPRNNQGRVVVVHS